jgi:putative nucleotidyltransferase with HDIG domain
VARRIFILFITCTLLPVTALAILSYEGVTGQLEQQGQNRLFQGVKSAGLIILERLQFISTGMKNLASSIDHSPSNPSQVSSKIALEPFAKKYFKALAVISPKGEVVPIFGDMKEIPSLKAGESDHLSSGKPLLTTLHPSGQMPRILLRTALGNQPEGSSQLVGEIKDNYLWEIVPDMVLPPNGDLCFLDHSGNVLFRSQSGMQSIPAGEIAEMVRSHTGKFEWSRGSMRYIAVYWSLFVKYEFHAPKWIIVISEPRDNVLVAAGDFKKTFTLILLLTIWVVLFLSFKQIQRSLVPLEKLREGTRRVAGQDFQAQVTVDSGDEFQELAESFNVMADKLDKQFKAMSTMNEIVRAILSVLDKEKIATEVLARLRDLFPADSAGLALFARRNELDGEMYVKDDVASGPVRLVSINLSDREYHELNTNPETQIIRSNDQTPSYIEPLSGLGMELFLVLPVFANNNLTAVMTLGFRVPGAMTEEDRVRARQLADQVALALTNANLVADLEELSWGTLYSLARAIDAKSSWTAGHSERVTELSLKIGQVMGLSRGELDDLHRAGLLHDIGKLGIPPEILDKPDKLSSKEYETMRQHAELGARILDPIAAYAKVKPLVLHHHEHYDGSGYPYGLKGEEIPMGARIFALADIYDALVSDRPYRRALNREEVREYVIARAGYEFDPKVVEAFLQVLSQQEEDTGVPSPIALTKASLSLE